MFARYVGENTLLTYPGSKPITLRWYIDDIAGISTLTKNELEDVIQYFNDFHP